jgi:hypothetical protein
MREMPGNTGADDTAADDDYVRCLHAICFSRPPIV